MQQDRLEQFITSNRDGFDHAQPPLKVWANVTEQLDQPLRRRQQRRQLLRMAAAIVALLVMGGLIGSYLTRVQANDPVALLKDIAPEYQEMADYYQTQIARQTQLVNNQGVDPEVFQDLDQIDSAMAELKQELRNAPRGKEQEIVENLIKSYQAKLAILERVLQRMNQSENLKNYSEDDISL